MVLGKLPVPGRPTIWITVGQGPSALAIGVGGGWTFFYSHLFFLFSFSPFSPSLWETARYRLKYCLKGLLNPKQPTNQFSLNLVCGYAFGIACVGLLIGKFLIILDREDYNERLCTMEPHLWLNRFPLPGH